jgi:hypothetical protein
MHAADAAVLVELAHLIGRSFMLLVLPIATARYK